MGNFSREDCQQCVRSTNNQDLARHLTPAFMHDTRSDPDDTPHLPHRSDGPLAASRLLLTLRAFSDACFASGIPSRVSRNGGKPRFLPIYNSGDTVLNWDSRSIDPLLRISPDRVNTVSFDIIRGPDSGVKISTRNRQKFELALEVDRCVGQATIGDAVVEGLLNPERDVGVVSPDELLKQRVSASVVKQRVPKEGSLSVRPH